MSNVTPPNGLQTIIGQEEPYGIFQQFLDADGSWKWVLGPSGTVCLTWTPDGAITFSNTGNVPQTAMLELTASQFLDPNGIVIVPAPGAGKVLVIANAYGQDIPGTIPAVDAQSVGIGWEGSSSVLDTDLALLNGQLSMSTVGNSLFTAVDVSDRPLVLVSSVLPEAGAILTSSLDTAGSGYVSSDTFEVLGGSPDATGIVDTATALIPGSSFPITAVDTSTPSFTIAGDHTALFTGSYPFIVSGASTPPAAVDTEDSNDSTSVTGTLTLVDGEFPADFAFSADGGSRISIPTAANLQTADFSVVAWVRAHGGGFGFGSSVILSTMAGAAGWAMYTDTGKLAAGVQPGAGVFTVGTTPIPTTGYQHVAVTFDSGGALVSLYLNGVLDTSAAAGLTISTSPLTIGDGVSLGSHFFNGDIASPAVYNVALSGGDIATLAAGGTIGTAAVSQWTFRESNNGSYTTVSSSFGGGDTTITVNELVTNTTADGDVVAASAGGEVLTYHLTDGGSGYTVSSGYGTNATSGTGAGLTINVDSVEASNDTARIWVTYSTLTLG